MSIQSRLSLHTESGGTEPEKWMVPKLQSYILSTCLSAIKRGG